MSSCRLPHSGQSTCLARHKVPGHGPAAEPGLLTERLRTALGAVNVTANKGPVGHKNNVQAGVAFPVPYLNSCSEENVSVLALAQPVRM